MSSRTFLVVIGVLLYVSNSTIAEQASAGDLSRLSADALSAMEGNQATLDAIRTMQAIITKSSSHSFPDEKSYSLEEKHKIIYDGEHFRKDQLETRFRGADEYKGYERALPIGLVDIDSAKSNIDYFPPNNRVFVRPPRWSDGYKIRENDLLRYQSARNATLKENILASAKNGYYFTATSDTVDRDDCVLLTCDYTNPESTLKIWVVPSKGYCIKKVQDGSKGKVDYEYTTILKEYSPGIWWFDIVQARKTTLWETIVSRLSVDSLTFNEPIDPEIFTVWGIDVSPETKITDEIQGTTYTLAIDDSKDTSVNPISYLNRMLVVWLGVLALAALVFLIALIKGKKRSTGSSNSKMAS